MSEGPPAPLSCSSGPIATTSSGSREITQAILTSIWERFPSHTHCHNANFEADD